MKILVINTKEGTGGAAGIARAVADGYRQAGHDVHFLVGQGTPRPDLTAIDPLGLDSAGGRVLQTAMKATVRGADVRGLARLRARRVLQFLSPSSAWAQVRGYEDFHLSGLDAAWARLPWRPDLVHLHNLHGFNHLTHFDLRRLPALSQEIPTLVTLHDPWLATGHCAHFFDCSRWQTGCGECPRLTVYPKVSRDETARNWQVKAELLGRSRLHVVGVCDWVTQVAKASLLAPALATAQTIPNGVDTTVLQPVSVAERRSLRREMGLHEDDWVVTYAAELGSRNPYRDFGAMRGAVDQLARSLAPRRVVAVELGGDFRERSEEGNRLRWEEGFLPASEVRRFLQVSDLLLHAALADTSPTIVFEAMACGLPTVATAVCGLPEQVADGETGFLVAKADADVLAEAALRYAKNPDLRVAHGAAARRRAEERFALPTMTAAYVRLAQSLASA